jgi:hypothetical protein
MAPSCYIICTERTRLLDPTHHGLVERVIAAINLLMPLKVDRAVSRIRLAPLGDNSTFNRRVVQNNGGLSSLNSGEAVAALMKTCIPAPGTI